MEQANIIPFEYEGVGVRVIYRHGESWFVARDVATALGYTNTRRAVKMHCPRRCPVGGSGTDLPLDPKTLLIPDSDVYRLATRSHLPSAARFEKWVMEEVLPSIRKTGSYTHPKAPQPEPVTVEALLRDTASLHRLLLGMTEQAIALKEEVISVKAENVSVKAENASVKAENNTIRVRVEELKPQAEALDRIATSNGSLCLIDAAKTLQVRPGDLIAYLLQHRWIYRRQGRGRLIAYQTHITRGDLEHKVTTITNADGSEKIVEQARVTPQGLAKLAKLLQPVAKTAPVQEELSLAS